MLFPTLPNTPAYVYVRESDKLPRIGQAQGEGVALVKLFDPQGSWTWYISEHGDKDDPDLCYGFVKGHEGELGYFSLTELREFRGRFGLPLERDLSYKPETLATIAKRESRWAEDMGNSIDFDAQGNHR